MKQKVYYLSMCFLLCAALFVLAVGQTEEEPQAEQVNLVLWDGQTLTKMGDKVDTAIQEFMKDNPNVNVEVSHFQVDAYKTKLKVAMGGGTPPDIFQNWAGGVLKEYVDSGMVHPIDEIKSSLLETYIPGAFDPATFDGRTYGSPFLGLTGVFFWYRKDVLGKYGLAIPKTQKEFVRVCDTLKNSGLAPISLANKPKWPGSFYYMYLADRIGGADLFLDALYRKHGRTFEDPAYIRAGEVLQQLVRSGYFIKGFNGLDYGAGQSKIPIYTGKAGMILMGTWFIGGAKKDAPEIADQLDFFSFPAVEGGKGDPSNLIGSPGQNYFSVASTCKDKAVALTFLRDYVMDESWIQFLASEVGYVPPVKGSAKYLSDPLLQKIAEKFGEAGHVQLYYDQFLSPALGEKHKDLVQALFGLAKTPEQVAREHEEAVLKEM